MGTKNIILLFLYVYPLFIVGIPLSTRIIFGVIGGCSFVLQNVHSRKEWHPLRALIPIIIWSMIVGTINQTYDYFFAFYGVSILLIFFAGVFLVNRTHDYHNSNQTIDAVLSAFVIVVIAQSVFALLFTIYPSFQSLCYKITPLTERELSAMDSLIGTRFIGLGSCYFGAGVIHGLALIAMSYLFIVEKVMPKLVWIFTYMIILFIGIMMARTTVIGLFCSILMIISWKPLNLKFLKQKILLIILLIVALLASLAIVLTYVDEKILMQAFEFFYNYNDNGSFESASTNRLKEMYEMPRHISTYIFGDGLYNLKAGGYYMSTDVGYMRLLYYGGIPMIVVYFYYQWHIVRKIILLGVSPQFQRFLYITFIYLLILNAKGFTDFSPYYLLFYTLLFRISYQHNRIKSLVSR